jgi:hypothetical protein
MAVIKVIFWSDDGELLHAEGRALQPPPAHAPKPEPNSAQVDTRHTYTDTFNVNLKL